MLVSEARAGSEDGLGLLVELASNREYGEAPTLESVISAYGEAISMSEEDPVQGYEATKKASRSNCDDS